MKNKKIISALLVITILASFGSVLAIEDLTKIDENFIPSIETCDQVLFEATEITDPAVLLNRAELDIDEFEENTDYSIDTTSIVSDNSNIEQQKTSQLLSVFETDGVEIEEYAVTIMSTLEPRLTETRSANGCTITTTLYIYWNTSNNQISLRHTTTTLSTSTVVSSLYMTNKVFVDLGDEYNNSQTWNNPGNGNYTLYTPAAKLIHSLFGEISATAKVTLANGIQFSTLVAIDEATYHALT